LFVLQVPTVQLPFTHREPMPSSQTWPQNPQLLSSVETFVQPLWQEVRPA
jgi:hypothetical protein